MRRYARPAACRENKLGIGGCSSVCAWLFRGVTSGRYWGLRIFRTDREPGSYGQSGAPAATTTAGARMSKTAAVQRIHILQIEGFVPEWVMEIADIGSILELQVPLRRAQSVST
jgi:hypothetical protein